MGLYVERGAIQSVSIVVIFAIMIVEMIWIRKHRAGWRYTVPIFAWMIASLVFYGFVFYSTAHMTTWSSILRLFGYLTIFIVELNRLIGEK